MSAVTDTHTLLWWFTESPKLGSKASQCFEKCEAGEFTIVIPTIVIAEALSIFDKKRINRQAPRPSNHYKRQGHPKFP